MQIRNILSLFLFLVSSTIYAVDTAQYPSKDACLKAFVAGTGNSNPVAGETYCKDKYVKTAMDFCAESKLLDFKKKNSVSSTEEPQYFRKFRNECILAGASVSSAPTTAQQAAQNSQQSLQQQQIAAQQAAAAAAAKAAADAAAAKKNQEAAAAQQKAQTQAQADGLKALGPALEKAGAEYDKAMGKDSKSSDAKSSGDSATAKSGGGSYTKQDPENLSEGTFVDKDGNTYEVVKGAGGTPDYVAKTPKGGGEAQEISADKLPDVKKVDGDVPQTTAAEVGRDMPGEVAEKAKKAEEAAATPSNANGGENAISKAAEAKTGVEKTEVTTTVGKLTTELRTWVYTQQEYFNQTATDLDAFKAKFETFTSSTKPTCSKLADTSSFLCVEAPGAKGAKALMDAAGPVLSIVQSMQKACSNMASVTGLAAKVMAMAKATCATAKLACDGGCALAAYSVTAMVADLKKIQTASINADRSQAMTMCSAECSEQSEIACSASTIAFAACFAAKNSTCLATCNANVTARAEKATIEIENLSKAISQESVPKTEGTVAATQTKCTMNGKDIAGMAINGLSLMQAHQSAKECDKQLAASGTAGGAVTPTQYCEQPANAATQFCKCQKNSNQEGCPGFTAAGNKDNKDAKKDGTGINTKLAGGVSGFAGGTNGSLVASKASVNGSKSSDGASSDSTKLSLSSEADSTAGGVGGAASSSGSGFGSGGSNSDTKTTKEEPKKWSFGSFASSIGGVFGGSSKSSKGGSNGSISAKQEAAIKRKLASDKLAGEITSASGKSNWEKVHRVYVIKENTNTLINGK